MHNEGNGNRPRGDDAAPPPADPGTQDPPLPPDTELLNHDADDLSHTRPEEEDPAQATHSPDTMNFEDFELVLNNGTKKRIKKAKKNKITITGPQPTAPQLVSATYHRHLQNSITEIKPPFIKKKKDSRLLMRKSNIPRISVR